jgi:hypothetical protein
MSPNHATDIASLSVSVREEGPRRFARWDGELFDTIVAGPTRLLAEGLAGQPDTEAILVSYLEMIQQGVGLALLRPAAAGSGGWTSFLERSLVQSVPALLPRVPPGERLSLLVKVWNLGEGLLREPPWLDRYVTARAAELTDLKDIETFLVHTLEPVLVPPPPAAWQGPFAVAVLDLRRLHDEFLPGALGLAAPGVLRVMDRRRPGLEAGVLLRPRGRSELLGLTGSLGEYAETTPLPAVTFADGQMTIGGRLVPVPSLRRCQAHAVVRAGFVAACAIDSQRLWIVESP